MDVGKVFFFLHCIFKTRAWLYASKITKALAVRNHDLVKVYVDRLFTLFGDTFLSWDAAKAIGEVAGGGEGILTKKNFAVLRVRGLISEYS